MSAGPTPGPWEVLDGCRVSVTLPSLTEGCGFDSHCVAMTHSSWGRLDAEANARAIAANPDLLQAAEQFLASVKDGNAAELIDYYADIFGEAVAKATGSTA